jgi:ElaB/YqjD/DUF883 family membrane-anchored ribosome-binding protein
MNPTRASGAGYSGRRRPSDDPAEIERDIRRTRADMSRTVDAIERRLSPERIGNELRNSVRETIDDVQHRLNPKRIANEAGRNMIDSIREHPVPALLAGLSIGYMLMAPDSRSQRQRRDYYYDVENYARPHRGGSRAYRFEDEYDIDYRAYGGRDTDEYDRLRARARAAWERGSDHEDEGRFSEMRHRASDAAGEASEKAGEFIDETRERASEFAHEARDRMSEYADYAGDRARRMGRQVYRGSRRAERSLEEFVDSNPLVAGALAAGVGALLGSLLPSTDVEDEWFGDTRDHLVEGAGEVVEHTAEKARHVAERVADEARDAVEEVADTARSEAGRVGETAREGAREVSEEAGRQTKEQF